MEDDRPWWAMKDQQCPTCGHSDTYVYQQLYHTVIMDLGDWVMSGSEGHEEDECMLEQFWAIREGEGIGISETTGGPRR